MPRDTPQASLNGSDKKSNGKGLPFVFFNKNSCIQKNTQETKGQGPISLKDLN